MNSIGFIRLINQIYRKKLPDLDWIQKQGLLAVKIGQTFALRIDFLNPEKCTHLSKLYTRANSISNEDLNFLLDKYTDNKWKSQFEYIDKNPLATASVGQVHRAKLKSGEEVVVKVIKGDFKENFRKDVKSVKSFMNLILKIYPKLEKVLDPRGIISHIEEYTLDELDLRNEISHGMILRKIYENNKLHYNLDKLKFPKIYEELSSENILVSEFIDGSTLDELLENRDVDYEKLIELFHIHGFYTFVIGTFHGDIHPGNIILKGENIYFIDTGAIGRVSDRVRIGLYKFMENLSYYRYDECANALNEMAYPNISGDRFENYKRKFKDLYSDFDNSTVSEVSLTQKMMHTIKLGVNSGMTFEKGMYPIIKSLMYLDGMVLKCKPDAKLMEDMRRFIEEFNSIENEDIKLKTRY